MTQEEKAKAYDEALKRIKNLENTSAEEESVINYIFPQLCESEDERIRKGLIFHLKELRNWKVGTEVPIKVAEHYDAWVAYLERQKEQKHSLNFDVDVAFDTKEPKDNWEYIKEFCNKFGRIPKDMDELDALVSYVIDKKQKWQKPAESGIYPPSLDEAIHLYFDTYGDGNSFVHLPLSQFQDIVKEFVRDYGQKPAEKLSKEEYVKKFKALCDAYEIKLPNREYDIYGLCEDLHKLFGDIQKPAERNKSTVNGEPIPTENQSVNIALSKEEKEKIRQNGRLDVCYDPEKYGLCHKIEWSEEDEKKLSTVISLMRASRAVDPFYDKMCLEGWLKSLRPQPRWKPSDEQMKSLDQAVCIFATFEHLKDDSKVLTSLYNDIQKLL